MLAPKAATAVINVETTTWNRSKHGQGRDEYIFSYTGKGIRSFSGLGQTKGVLDLITLAS